MGSCDGRPSQGYLQGWFSRVSSMSRWWLIPTPVCKGCLADIPEAAVWTDRDDVFASWCL